MIFRELNTRQDHENFISVAVGTDTLKEGYAIKATELAGALVDGLGAVYVPEMITNIEDNDIAVVIPDEVYEDSMGNRLNITDPKYFEFSKKGKNIRALRLLANSRYFATPDVVTAASVSLAVKGNYLIPTAGSFLWTAVASIPADVKGAFLIEDSGVAGSFVGLNGVEGMFVRCVRALNA